MKSLLLTGGSGRLGTELRRLLPGIIAPTRAEMDITDLSAVRETLERYHPEAVVHAAAFTDIVAAEMEHGACWRVNVEGTRHLVRSVVDLGVFLIHISTDYVFEGRCGMYREDDTPGPVCNFYALSKLVAEEVARTVPRHLIIRTSFRPRQWPYPVAFTDMYSSQDYVDVLAPEIALAIRHFADIPYDTVHIASERKSAFDLARRRRQDVEPRSKAQAGVALPDDVSLEISRWMTLKRRWDEAHG